jgi:hypothetical protein
LGCSSNSKSEAENNNGNMDYDDPFAYHTDQNQIQSQVLRPLSGNVEPLSTATSMLDFIASLGEGWRQAEGLEPKTTASCIITSKPRYIPTLLETCVGCLKHSASVHYCLYCKRQNHIICVEKRFMVKGHACCPECIFANEHEKVIIYITLV